MIVAYVQQVISGWPSKSATELTVFDIFIWYLCFNLHARQNSGVIICELIRIAEIELRSSPKLE